MTYKIIPIQDKLKPRITFLLFFFVSKISPIQNEKDDLHSASKKRFS